jgi:hypothetical protein
MVNVTFYKKKKKHFIYLLNQEKDLRDNDRNEKRISRLELKISDCNKRIREMKKNGK